MTHRPGLAGKGIVVTRALNQAASLERALSARGAVPLHYPCIAIQPPSDTRALDECLADLAGYDALLFTSANVVAVIAQRMKALDLQPDWSRIQVGLVGKATEAALYDHFGAMPDLGPAAATSAELARALPSAAGSRILLPQSTVAGDYLADLLRGRGGRVSKVIAYETALGSGGVDLPAQIAAGAVDALTFVSPSAARNFTRRCTLPAAKNLPAACLGPVTAERAAELGFSVVVAPPTTGVAAMLDALAAHFDSQAGSSAH